MDIEYMGGNTDELSGEVHIGESFRVPEDFELDHDAMFRAIRDELRRQLERRARASLEHSSGRRYM